MATLQALVRQLHPGQGVIFYREPSNPADPHAVAVYTAGMQQLGYLPRYTAQSWQLQVTAPHTSRDHHILLCSCTLPTRAQLSCGFNASPPEAVSMMTCNHLCHVLLQINGALAACEIS